MAEHFIKLDEARNDVLACATYLAEEIGSADGYGAAMMTLVPRYLTQGNVDLAAELANTVADPFVRDKLLILVAGKCAAIDDDEYAFQLADAVEDFGLQEMARERIALEKAAKSDFETALTITGNLEHPSNAYAGIAINQAKVGEQAAAEQTIEMIDFPAAKVAALQNVAMINLQKSETAKAVELLEKAADAASNIEHDEEEIRAWTEIAIHFIEADRKDKAVETFSTAKGVAETLDNVHRDSFLAGIAHGLLRAGSIELADRTLDLVKDKTQISSCLVGFSQEYWAKDEKTEAVEALEEAYAILKSQRDSETRDTKAKLALFSTIAVQFAKFEKPERAIEIAQENIDAGEQLKALAQIAQVCTSQGKDEIARQALDDIFDEGQKMFALIGMSDIQNNAGKTEEAISLLKEADEKIEIVPQLSLRLSACIELADRFAKHGKTETVHDLLREGLATVAALRGESIQSVALASLAEAFQRHDIALSDEDRQMLFEMVQKKDW